MFQRVVNTSVILVCLVCLALVGAGCDESTEIFQTVNEEELAPPLGLMSVTGNGQVTLSWFTSNFESDFEGYIVYQADGGNFPNEQSLLLPGGFDEIERIPMTSSGDVVMTTVRGLTNGTTVSFAVCAFRRDGEEISRTSNIISDTPRPDINQIILTSASTADVTGDDSTAGFRLDGFVVGPVPTNLALADYMDTNGTSVVHEAFDPGAANTNIRSWLAGMNGGGVQDLGFMANLDGSDVAPTDGYAANGESVLLTAGHVYAIRTGDGRYGKVIVTSIAADNSTVTMNAAFQTKADDPNYMPALGLR